MTMDSPQVDAALPERLYEWFNSLVRRPGIVTEAEVRTFWAEDCVMVINGQIRCSGVVALTKHFSEVPQRLKSWQVELPLLIRIAQKDRLGVYYRIRIVKNDGSEAVLFNGAFFEIRQGKLSRMTEIQHLEPTS
jgi:hypothetical protein